MRLRAVTLLVVVLAVPRGAAAYDGGSSEGSGLHTATSLGARATFFRPTDADHGAWAPGAQLRLHMSDAYSFEASSDFVEYRAAGTNVSVTPVQTTVIGYFYPDASFSPYLLLGCGWYPTHADGPYVSPRLFGPHIGAGLELLLGENWTIDGSYRFLWTEIITLSDPTHLWGKDFSERGHMFTVALSYRL
jgi:opacity protein-like surface antigen